MDLSQKANRVKHDLQAVASKLDATTVRHAIGSFETFADAVVEEIELLKKANKEAARTSSARTPTTAESQETTTGTEERRENAAA